MTHESICATLRLAWIRFVIHSNRICSQNYFGTTGRVATLTLGHCGGERVKQIAENFSTQVHKAFALFAKRCNVIAGQRIWRAWQIASLYRQLYGEKLMLQALRANLLRHCRNRQLFMLLSAAGIFHWERDGVTDEELKSAVDEMDAMEKLVTHAKRSDNNMTPSPEGWEIVIDQDHLRVWRRHISTHSLFEYRVFGSFVDISATAFYNTQMDLEFWAAWDQQTAQITVIDHDKKTSSEVIHWVYKFPYPMYPRDYCYVRRYQVNSATKRMVIRGKAVEHPKCPKYRKFVRVTEYNSQLVIMPHTTFDAHGFDYYLTYYDDPQTQLPSVCYNWLASTGVPDFVENLHVAARAMEGRMKKGYTPNLHNYTDETPRPPLQNASNVLHTLQQNYC